MAAEGKWTKQQMVLDAMLMVDVGVASRQTQRQRRDMARARGNRVYEQGEHRNHHPLMWRPGQRKITQQALINLIKRGRVVVGDDGIVRLPQ